MIIFQTPPHAGDVKVERPGKQGRPATGIVETLRDKSNRSDVRRNVTVRVHIRRGQKQNIGIFRGKTVRRILGQQVGSSTQDV